MDEMTIQKISAYFDHPDRRAELVSHISRLVAVKSVKGEAQEGAPFGPGPRAALDEALALCRELGFTARDYDHYVGLCDLNDKPTQLHILGHLDVVGEGSGWDTDPYTCVEREGILYGRGVSDDKGPVCAALLAMKAVRDLGLPLSKNARLILGTDEESGSGDIEYYYAREPYAPQSFSPDADFPLINVEKGHYFPLIGAQWAAETALPRVTALDGGFRFNVVPPDTQATVAGVKADSLTALCRKVEEKSGTVFTLTDTPEGVQIACHGKNAHASHPQDGINSISALLEVLAPLDLADCPSTRAIRAMARRFPFGDTRGAALGIAQGDEVSGDLTLNLAIIHLDSAGFTAQLDVRLPVCATEENCAQVVRDNLGEDGIQILENPEMGPVHMVEADSPLVRTLLNCYSVYTGVPDPKPLAIGGGTYVHYIPGGVAFGCDFPDFDSRMHAANEQAKVDNLLLSAKIFALAIGELCQ